jgi:hypothetical protein
MQRQRAAVVTRTNTCPYSVHPRFKFYSGHQLHYGFSSHSSVPPQNASNWTTTASFHTLLGYWELLCAFPHTASRNEVQISGASYSPDITDGYVTDRSSLFLLTLDICPASIHTKGEAGPVLRRLQTRQLANPLRGNPRYCLPSPTAWFDPIIV